MKIDRFLDYLKLERNYSRLTVLKYESCLRLFEEYFKNLNTELEWESVDADVIRGWMESLMDRGNNASTVNTGLSALRSFFRYALARKLVNRDPAHMITGPKKRKPLPQFVKEEEINQLLDKTEWGADYKDVRARTIIIILYEAGLRRSELIGLNDSDVDLDAMQLKVTGKRNKQRIVPFGKELAEQLGQYIACRDEEIAKRSEALFLNNKGERISEAEVYNTVRENLAKVTTLKKKSPHVLRHSFATAMLNHDAGLESVRKLLGHESLETTQIYTHTTFEQLKRVYKEALPRD
jgi:integrase/recombinase XerC